MNARPIGFLLLTVVFLTATLAACGNTWSGVREDTGQAMEATGGAIEGAGEAVKPDEEN